MLQPRHLGLVCLLVALSVPACNSGVTDPGRELRLSIIAGAVVSDTALAIISQALTIEIRDLAGRPASGQEVRFSSLPHEFGGKPSVQLALLESPWFESKVVDMTDSQGRVRVLVRLGSVAGLGLVQIEAQRAGLADTARFGILPGVATSFSLEPKDTAMHVGGSYSPRIVGVDRHGNPSESGVVLSAGTEIMSAEGGLLTARAIGRSYVVAHSNEGGDTAWVSIVPPGVIAAHRRRIIVPGGEGLVLFNTDGSELQDLLDFPDRWGTMAPTWSPDGSTLLIQSLYHLFRVDLSGQLERLIPEEFEFTSESWGRYTADGEWIYFSGARHDDKGTIWRIRADGTDAEQVGPPAGDQQYSYPSLSPDGTRLIFARKFTHTWWLYSLDLWTGAVEELKIRGESPRWSPLGDWIAYVADYSVRIMTPDGSEQRIISTPLRTYDPGIDWSPDGKWIVVRPNNAPALDLINVESGLTLPLAFTRGELDLPAWRPRSGGSE